MDFYYPRQWLVALAAVLGRPLEVSDLKALFKVKKEAETLGGCRCKRVVFFMFGDQHIQLLVSDGIAATILRRDDILANSVLMPISKFNEAACIDRLSKANRSLHRTHRVWPKKRDFAPMGSHGPGGNRHVSRNALNQQRLRQHVSGKGSR